MENLISIADVLFANIVSSNREIPEKLTEKLSKSPFGQRLLTKLNHFKTHKNLSFKLKNCEQLHCIECLHECEKCDHDKQLTLYEKSYFSLLQARLDSKTKPLTPKRTCTKCLSSDLALNFLKDSCMCECFVCLNKRLAAGQNTCSICSKPDSPAGIQKLFELLSLPFFGQLKPCPSCSLPIHTDGFINDICFVCSKIKPYL